MDNLDEEDAKQICRTCLKSTTKVSALFDLTDCGTTRKTFAELLEKYAQFEFSTDQEAKLPQGLCPKCCFQLKRFHKFIIHAQKCNHKLMGIAIANQSDCLREEAIDLPANLLDYGDDQMNINVESDSSDDDGGVFNGIDVLDESLPHEDMEGLLDKDEHLERDHKQNDDTEEEETIISSEAAPAENIPDGFINDNHTSSLSNKTVELSANVTCPICSKVLKKRIYLVKHLQKLHAIENAASFIKIHCGRKQTNYENCKIVCCRHCDYTAKSSAALKYHKRTKHTTEEDKYKCKFCLFESLKRLELVGHVKNDHKLEFKTLKRNLEKKRQTVGGQCNDSDSQESVGDVFKHISLDESSDDDGFIRDMITEDRRLMKSKFVDGEPFNSLARKCDVCGKVYKNFQSLYAHKRFVHISEDMYSVCLHCGKKYKRSQDLKNHILQIHTAADSSEATVQIPDIPGKRFMCTECPYATTTTTHLNIHIRRHHTGEKPFVCEICGNSFLTSYCLKKHRYLHTGEKPHKCPFCPKTFRVSSKLTKHKRTHTGERPFKCSDCGKCFTQEYNLSVHKRTHTRERKIMLPVQW